MRRRLAAEDGFTLVELLTVVALLAVVLAGIANLLVSGSRAQRDTSGRVDAQQGARLALDRLEYEARCSSYAASVNSGAGVTLALPSQCSHATGTVTWCVSSGVLARYAGSTCSGSGTPYVSSVTSATPFSLQWSTGDLPRLQVRLTVNDTGSSSDSFTVNDAIALRNSAATLGAPSPTSGAVGSSITITGSNFKPSAALTVTFGSLPATVTGGGTSSSSGTATVTFTIPFSGDGSFPITVSDGTNSATSSSNFTVTGSFDGLKFTSTSLSGSGVLTCGSPSQTVVCNATPLGATGHVTGSVTLATAAGGSVTNAGSAIAVGATEATTTNPGGTVSPTSSTIAANASASSSGFTLTGLGTGWNATMTCTLTVNSVSYSIAVTGN
jgi:prepilin-type N-terminal cleavage/methylation domain-containing protein